jgi:deleted-in-malignant-brain-tumors protein 1
MYIAMQMYIPLLTGYIVGCRHGAIRLKDGSNERRVEVCYYNSWGTVCGNLWSTEDANVLCHQLGLGSTGQ